MNEPQLKNAIIESTTLGVEDHGIFSYFLHLKYGDSSSQGSGGYCLDTPVMDGTKFLGRVGMAYGAETIRKILEVLEVSRWEKLPGTPCRVISEHEKVHRIGHYLKDKWFDPKLLADEMRIGK